MLLRSSRLTKSLTKEGGLAGGIGKALWKATKFTAKNPLKATGIGLGGLAAGGAGVTAAKGVAGSLKKPTSAALAKRRTQGFGRKAESMGDAQGRAFGTVISGAQKAFGG